MSMTYDEIEAMCPKREWRSPLPPICAKCAYNLTGLTEDRCPECGTPFKWKEVQKRAARMWSMALRLRHANQDAKMGALLGLSGWFAVGLAILIRNVTPFLTFLTAIIFIAAFLAAIITVVLGAQVLNLRRVPPWLRPYISNPPPSMLLGWATILLGLSLFLGASLILYP